MNFPCYFDNIPDENLCYIFDYIKELNRIIANVNWKWRNTVKFINNNKIPFIKLDYIVISIGLVE